MSELFSLIQKVVLIAIFSWLGIQFSPTETDKEDAKAAPEQVISSLLR